MVKFQLDQNVVNLFDITGKSMFYVVNFDNFFDFNDPTKGTSRKGYKSNRDHQSIKDLLLQDVKEWKKLVHGNMDTIFSSTCQTSNKGHAIDTQIRISTTL